MLLGDVHPLGINYYSYRYPYRLIPRANLVTVAEFHCGLLSPLSGRFSRRYRWNIHESKSSAKSGLSVICLYSLKLLSHVLEFVVGDLIES